MSSRLNILSIMSPTMKKSVYGAVAAITVALVSWTGTTIWSAVTGWKSKTDSNIESVRERITIITSKMNDDIAQWNDIRDIENLMFESNVRSSANSTLISALLERDRGCNNSCKEENQASYISPQQYQYAEPVQRELPVQSLAPDEPPMEEHNPQTVPERDMASAISEEAMRKNEMKEILKKLEEEGSKKREPIQEYRQRKIDRFESAKKSYPFPTY